MAKRIAFVLVVVFFACISVAQTVGQYRFHKKTYFVYPLRIDDEGEIPQPGIRVPDGAYVVFHNYIFKEKRFRKHRLVLKDTARVVAYVHVKNGSLDGPATIYEYDTRNNYTLKRRPNMVTSGRYTAGLKDSTWTHKHLRYGWYYTSEYKNDLQNGYHCLYSRKGRPEMTTKYKDGERVDTVVYYYMSGQVERIYDLYPDSEKTDNKNIYARALTHFQVFTFENGPKTFYRSYSEKGLLMSDLKYSHGQPLPFDSISYMGITVSVANGANGKSTIRVREPEKRSVTYIEDEYANDFMTRHTRREYAKKLKLAITSGYELFPLDTMADPGRPQLLVAETWGKTFYIPKYRFSYQQESRSGITSIDPHVPVISISDTSEADGEVTIVRTKRLIPQDSATGRALAHNPYLNKSFVVTDDFPGNPDPEDHYNGSNLLQEVTRDYSEQLVSTQFFKAGKPINGRVFLQSSDKKWKSNDSLTEINEGSYDEMSKGRLLNGTKQGMWEEVYIEDSRRRYSAKNLWSYFLAHPGRISNYETISYRDGMKNGPSVDFRDSDEDDFESLDWRFDKVKKAELWKKNLSKSKKHFVYKCLEREFVNDTLNGPYKSYYSNTGLHEDMTFLKGRPHGNYKRYSMEGTLLSSGHFNNGKLEGAFYSYNDPLWIPGIPAPNILRMKATFRNNLLNDTLLYYYDGVKPYMAIGLRNDTLEFKKEYFQDGRLQEDIRFTPQSAYTINKDILESSNYIDIVNGSGNDEITKAEADYRSYYENGQVLAEGKIAHGYPGGGWKFYNINGTLVHQINFTDTTILLPGAAKAIEVSGFYTGYYGNGKLRCRGYLDNISLSYDCFVKQDKPDLDFYVMDFYDIEGKQLVSGGNGYLVKYDENGLRMAAGKLVNCREDSLWKYYTPEQKLTRIGNYVHQKKDGVWYDGDLEGINFEDGACFDQNNAYEMEEYKRKRKELRINKTVYVNGMPGKRTSFSSDLNKMPPSRSYGSDVIDY